ncbi:hypothetical protein PHPALM_29713 [Phytophthora palmivora]|uniref:Uncharacterized protein n=1 Tax=Phytophthora palmivora TaxID=4796 RepID=A0A2P4X6Y4_9STRA|nr:hypothetical protein PHPALM_29713 [Phytophthora palmivora]
MNRSALDLHRVASDTLKRDMERSASSSPATDSGRGGQSSFSTFLMDEVASPVQLQRLPKRPPPPLPPLRAQAASRADNTPPRRRHPPPDVSRRRGESDGDIPVLEAARDSSGFRLDGADQAEVRVNSDDEEVEARVVVGEYDAEEDDFVPVLQTAEDALRAHRSMGRDAAKNVDEEYGIVVELFQQQFARVEEKFVVYAD